MFISIKYVPLSNYVMSYYAGKSVESVPNIYILLIIDPPAQQGCIVKIFRRSSDQPGIERCPATGVGYCEKLFLWGYFIS